MGWYSEKKNDRSVCSLTPVENLVLAYPPLTYLSF